MVNLDSNYLLTGNEPVVGFSEPVMVNKSKTVLVATSTKTKGIDEVDAGHEDITTMRSAGCGVDKPEICSLNPQKESRKFSPGLTDERKSHGRSSMTRKSMSMMSEVSLQAADETSSERWSTKSRKSVRVQHSKPWVTNTKCSSSRKWDSTLAKRVAENFSDKSHSSSLNNDAKVNTNHEIGSTSTNKIKPNTISKCEVISAKQLLKTKDVNDAYCHVRHNYRVSGRKRENFTVNSVGFQLDAISPNCIESSKSIEQRPQEAAVITALSDDSCTSPLTSPENHCDSFKSPCNISSLNATVKSLLVSATSPESTMRLQTDQVSSVHILMTPKGCAVPTPKSTPKSTTTTRHFRRSVESPGQMNTTSPGVFAVRGSPALKRNVKGETVLHTACIKVGTCSTTTYTRPLNFGHVLKMK